MEMYHMGKFQASAAANIYIYVTPHEFWFLVFEFYLYYEYNT